MQHSIASTFTGSWLTASPAPPRISVTTARILATVLPLAVMGNRFVIHVQLFYNDLVVLALCMLTVCLCGVRWQSRTVVVLVAFYGYVSIHSVLIVLLDPAVGPTVLNQVLRITNAVFCAIVMCTFYSQIRIADAVIGLRRAAIILGWSILVHGLLLNALGETGRQLALLQEHEILSAARDQQWFGLLRPYGIAAEPAFAAGSLFLCGALLAILRPDKYRRTQWFLVMCAIVAWATSLVLFLPLWLWVLARNKRRLSVGAAVLAGAGALFLLGTGGAEPLQKLGGRFQQILAGRDASFNQRVVPMTRTAIGVVTASPMLGFGMGQARRADLAGYGIVEADLLIRTAPETYSGVIVAEMLGDFGIPGILLFAAILFFVAMQGSWNRRALLWGLCIFLTQNCYVYRNVQLLFWAVLGVLVYRSARTAIQTTEVRYRAAAARVIG